MKKMVSRKGCVMLLLISSSAVWATVGIGDAAASGKGIRTPVCNPGAPIGNPADIEAIKQLGRSMVDAMVAVDISKLKEIYADDWATVGSSGTVHTKQSLLDNVESGKSKLLWYELGPIDVQVAGDVAVAHGTVKERRINGFDGEVVCMDLLRKRAGKWVVVRSAGATANAES